ncbi:hypothetical protein FACS189498_0960 [Spirochaetia bacterium]|nr:hypothetical protein FACS189498_0960 [Spirochaetia bacterium]
MEERKIVWDTIKAAENLTKHRVSFDTAALVFLDPLRLECRDDSEGNISGEERWQTLGRVGSVYFVVYAEREDTTRIITARAATKAEKRSYHGTDNRNLKGWTKAD